MSVSITHVTFSVQLLFRDPYPHVSFIDFRVFVFPGVDRVPAFSSHVSGDK